MSAQLVCDISVFFNFGVEFLTLDVKFHLYYGVELRQLTLYTQDYRLDYASTTVGYEEAGLFRHTQTQ